MKTPWQRYALGVIGIAIGGGIGKALFHVALLPAAGTVVCAAVMGWLFWKSAQLIKF